MSQRVVVFLDWQNVYRRARDAFFLDGDPHTCGQVDPVALARLLAARVPNGVLQQVRIYRGIPTNKADPKGYAANRRQTAAWKKNSDHLVEIYLRPLQYLPNLPPREKGIDVQLAIDYVVLAVRGQYDVGILFSNDTDLVPALDAVFDLNGSMPPHPRVAAWSGPNDHPRRITPSGKRSAPCIWLDEAAFNSVADLRDYGQP